VITLVDPSGSRRKERSPARHWAIAPTTGRVPTRYPAARAAESQEDALRDQPVPPGPMVTTPRGTPRVFSHQATKLVHWPVTKP
jgi:hypothetical protein